MPDSQDRSYIIEFTREEAEAAADALRACLDTADDYGEGEDYIEWETALAKLRLALDPAREPTLDELATPAPPSGFEE